MLTWLRPFKLFVPPPAEVFQAPDLDFMDGARTYAEYNYLRPGIASRIKAAHFEAALEVTRGAFGEANAIDFGCADGFFLPSLSQHFRHVAAIDRVPKFVDIAKRVVAAHALANVEVHCNEGRAATALRDELTGRDYRVAFCLEVLEHAGEADDLYGSKMRVLADLFSLMADDARVVVSVPTMVGLPFLIQRAGLAAFGSWREPLGMGELLRAGLLRDTRELERRWDGGHLGFNHLRLEEAMSASFTIERRKNLGFQMLYVVRRA